MTRKWRLDPIVRWLLSEGRMIPTLDAFIPALADQLLTAGLPLWRLRLGMRTLHPLFAAHGGAWERDDGAIVVPDASHGLETLPSYVGSPFEIIVKTEKPFRRKLDKSLGSQDHRVLHELRARGATDYFGLLLFFAHGSGGLVTFVTDDPDGFTETDIAQLTELATYLSPIVETYRLHHATQTISRAYLGPRSAERVLSGQITRGHIETIRAAIMVSDIRGWTELNTRASPDDAVALANRYFDILSDAISNHDGEVLKLMGDGLLAIFPNEDTSRACNCALAAACAAQDMAQSDPPLGADFGIAMHVGDVLYGNIGSDTRLDFTVMGAAVNLAARLEGLCSKYARNVLFSEAFAQNLSDPVQRLGMEDLKGLGQPQPVFGLTTL